jgi:pyridoxine/pyridoxamine 5'-phosphate oxidase
MTVASWFRRISKIQSSVVEKFTEEGFIFYTNYNSEKGKAIEANLKYLFFWHSMERQVIIKGWPKGLQKSFLM